MVQWATWPRRGWKMAQQRSPSLKRESWPRRVWGFWLDHRWTALAVLWGVAFVLGVVGFGRYHASRAEPRGLMDLVYLSLQLFVLESGAVFGPAVGLDLQIARILAPAVTLVSLY